MLVDGVPPGNDQDQVSGLLVDKSVNCTDSFIRIFVLSAIKFAVGPESLPPLTEKSSIAISECQFDPVVPVILIARFV